MNTRSRAASSRESQKGRSGFKMKKGLEKGDSTLLDA